jgi:predicted DNA binding protein
MDGHLRHVTLRVEHDCPMANLSRRFPQADFHAWMGHRLEVVEVRASPAAWEGVAEAAAALPALHVLPARGGGILVWEPRVAESRSISRLLEARDLLWLQPMHVQAGWEHYEAIAFSDEQEAIDRLRREWPTQVVRRRGIGPEDLLASLFLSLHPALRAPTTRQAEALLAAARADGTPSSETIAALPATLGIGRSAFEERLRAGENRVLAAVLPALEARLAQG